MREDGVNQGSDLRVARTRKAIVRAFLELASELDLSKITVKAVAERAEINRKTFYLHFETIEDLFESYLNSVMDEFFEHHEETPDKPEDIEGHARRFFLFLVRQSSVVEKLLCAPGRYDFGERIYATQMARYRAAGNPFGWMPEGEMELVLSFIRTTALDFYRRWVRDGKLVEPERAADLLAGLTCNGVSHLMR